jgi:hypothetical protein
MDWSKYGEWRHPNEWWQIQLVEYMKVTDPEKLKFNPKIIEVNENKIVFGMKKHYGHLHLSKKLIMDTLKERDPNKEWDERFNQLYSEIETAIIHWSNDGTQTAGTLTREIIELLKKKRFETIKFIQYNNE